MVRAVDWAWFWLFWLSWSCWAGFEQPEPWGRIHQRTGETREVVEKALKEASPACCHEKVNLGLLVDRVSRASGET
jgi:hypothetical protein